MAESHDENFVGDCGDRFEEENDTWIFSLAEEEEEEEEEQTAEEERARQPSHLQ